MYVAVVIGIIWWQGVVQKSSKGRVVYMQRVSVSRAMPGMVIDSNVYSANGRLLLRSGLKLTDPYIKRLQGLGISSIYVKNPLFDDIDVPFMLGEETRVKAIKNVQESFEYFRTTQKIDMKQFQDITRSILGEVMEQHAIVHLTDIRTHDAYTFGHSVNVCVLSLLTGIGLGYSDTKLRELALGALLHDIGKMVVSPEILNKQGRYTSEEMEIMKHHAALGFDILRKYWNSISLMVAHIAFQHHEKFDGSGYPRGLKGERIHEYARIVAIADVYDAMISDRPYREGMLPHEAFEQMMSVSNTHFDPKILQVFFKNVAIYPLGTVIQLNTGEIGVVVKVYPDLQARPRVKMIADKDMNILQDKREIDLTEHRTIFVQRVLKEEDIFKLGILTAVFKNMTAGLEEKEYVTDALGKYLTKDVVTVILKKGLQFTGELRIATILFTDIENYTTLSEGLDPENVVEMLNDYFSQLVDIISYYKGNVNKFIGDSVLALFNVPVDDPMHACNAIRAALEIQAISRQRGFGKKNIFLNTRIGINTGNVIAGNIGSKDRMEYTVIGDPVNVASRLEQLNKNYGSRILVGQRTYDLAKYEFKFDLIGTINVKGKKECIDVYKVIEI